MKVKYNLSLLSLLLPFILIASIIEPTYDKEKVLNKSFTVADNNTLEVFNKYGTISVNTWEKDSITIEVVIKTSGNNEVAVEEKLDNILVDFEQTEDLVKAITSINNPNQKWSWKKKHNVNFTIDYVILMPINNNIILDNSYGDILITSINGTSTIRNDYGGISIDYLGSSSNKIFADYCKDISITYAETASLVCDYSDIHIEEIKNISVRSDYSNINITNGNRIAFNGDYSKLSVGKTKEIISDGSHSKLSIGSLEKSATIGVSYGYVKVKEFSSLTNNITISSKYSPVTIGLNKSNSFQFDLKVNYGSISIPEMDCTFENQIKEKTQIEYKGYYNTKSNTKIVVKNNYGNIQFNSK